MATKKNNLKKLNRDMLMLYTFLIGVSIVLECIFLVATYKSTEKQLKTETRAYAEELASSITSELHKGFESLELFKDLYHVYGDLFLNDFRKICEELTKDNLVIGSMYFAPKGIIKYAYPVTVDSVTANFEMLKDPIQGPKAQKAIDTRKATIAGPHNLIEGGEGFIIRNPIFDKDKFVAFAIIVLDKDRLTRQISGSIHKGRYNFAIRKKPDPTAIVDDQGYILKSFIDTDKISHDIELSFDVLNDTWYVAIEPIGGWNVWHAMKKEAAISIIIFTILAYLFYMLILAVGRKRQLQMEIFSNNAKSSFLFSMSHDIRTPMNAIIGFANLMQKNLDKPEKLADYLEKIHASSNFLLSLINNVLEMAKIESGKMTLQEKVINTQSFEDVTDAVFTDWANNKGIAFSNEYHLLHPYVVGDEMKIREITLNIISNAIKYTPAGGFVKLSLVESEGSKPGYTLFTAIAEDSGVGISRDFLPHIFEEFSRERNSTDSKIAGTGLGMPIAKKLIDLMDGTIDIQSEVGHGTKITIKLPLKLPTDEQIANAKREEMQNTCINKANEATKPGSKNPETTLQDKRILLAEDNDLNAEIAIALLEEFGATVERSVDGFKCVQKLQECPDGYFDLILMDIQMPNMDGYEATSIIRVMDNKAKANIPIIAMTANAFDEDRQKAFNAGMNGHVAKPISNAELLKTLSQVFS